jgi:hypothetical protein
MSEMRAHAARVYYRPRAGGDDDLQSDKRRSEKCETRTGLRSRV